MKQPEIADWVAIVLVVLMCLGLAFPGVRVALWC